MWEKTDILNNTHRTRRAHTQLPTHQPRIFLQPVGWNLLALWQHLARAAKLLELQGRSWSVLPQSAGHGRSVWISQRSCMQRCEPKALGVVFGSSEGVICASCYTRAQRSPGAKATSYMRNWWNCQTRGNGFRDSKGSWEIKLRFGPKYIKICAK